MSQTIQLSSYRKTTSFVIETSKPILKEELQDFILKNFEQIKSYKAIDSYYQYGIWYYTIFGYLK